MKTSDISKEQDHEAEDCTTKNNPSFPGLEEEEEEEEEDAELEEVEEHDIKSASTSSRPKNGSSSSNSTVEESDKKANSSAGNTGGGSVRPYVRSKNPRLRWTPELHLRFIHAVEKLGGQERATPKLVLQLMNIKGLSISHVKSHLQMYRSKKIDDTNLAVSEQRFLYEGDDHLIYNFSQLPMLQNSSQKSVSDFRFSDGLWSTRHTNPNYNPFIINGVYGSRAERFIFEKNNTSKFRYLENSNTQESQLRLQADHKDMIIINDQDKMLLKRKALNDQHDPENHDLDLNLSLQMKTQEDDDTRKDEVNDSGLSLSLFSSISSKSPSNCIRRSKHAKTVGDSSSSTTLDLTL